MKIKAKLDSTALQRMVKKLEKLARPLTPTEADQIGKIAVSEMKEMISKGISPIEGNGRFPAYKNVRGAKKGPKGGRPHGYPYSVMGKYPGKRVTPVNLELSGDQLADLDHEVIDRGGSAGVAIGYSDAKQIVKEKGHREMANGQPSRPTIPSASDGEAFAKRIQDAFLKVVFRAIDRIKRSD